MLQQSLLLVVVVFHFEAAQQFEIENGVIGKPEVFCGIDTIRVKVNTERSFNGRIYVDGESDKNHCVQSSDTSHINQEFSIPIGACNMRRQRTLHPRGISFSFTMIVSFHPFFVTGIDRAFSIRCFFLESIKGLNAEIDVGTIAPQNIDQEYSLPVCAYHLKDGIEGHVLRFAQVGQKVTHVWRCDQDASHVYGMLIHSCYADDGRGSKFELVDDRGCSTDPFLLPHIEYEADAISAFTNAHVFKYADKIQLYFTCTVQLCYKHDGGCDGITPPVCTASDEDHRRHPDLLRNDRDEIDNDEHQPTSDHPSFIHLEQPNSIFDSARPSSSFQPIILGSPSPNIFSKDDPRPTHSVPPFNGPDVLHKNEEPSPYRRDSPINETDDDILMEVVTLRTTVPVPLNPSTAELVTFKPIVQSTSQREDVELLTTTRSHQNGLPIKKNKFGDMETDVSVDVIVLPVEDKERKDSRISPQSLSFSSSSEVCLSKLSTAILSTAIFLALFCCSVVTFYATRQRNRNHYQQQKRSIDNF